MKKINLLNQNGMTMVNDYKDEMPLELFRNKYAPEMYFDTAELFVTEHQYDKPILEFPKNESKVAMTLVKNGEALHKALRHLPNSVLLNERLWLWLSLVEYHEFVSKSMRANRGSANNAVKNFENTVLLGKEKFTTNYLFSMFWLTDRAASVDEGYDYSRLKVVFEHLNNFKQFIKLPFANSRVITECFVDFVHLPKYTNLNSTFYSEFLKMLNEVAGLLLLDSFDKEEILALMRQVADDVIANPNINLSADEKVTTKPKPKSKPKKKKKAAPKPKVEKVVVEEDEEEESAEDYYEDEPEQEEEVEEVAAPKDDLDSLLERQREAQAEREERDREEEWRRNNSNTKKNSFLDED